MATTTTISTAPAQGYVVTQQPPTIIAVNDQPHPATRNKKTFLGLGAIQISIGILCLILGVVGYVPAVTGTYIYIGSGIWSGILYIVLGSFGVSAGKGPNSCNVTACLVLGIIAALTAFSIGIVESLIAASARFISCSGYYYYGYDRSCRGAFAGIHGTLAAFSFIEFIISIVHSSLCCYGCCNSSASMGHVIAATTVSQYPAGQIPIAQVGQTQYYQPQPIMMQPTQPVLMHNQPVPYQGQPGQMQPQMQNHGSAGYPQQGQQATNCPPPYGQPEKNLQ